MLLRWLAVLAGACILAVAGGVIFGRLRPQSHNIAILFLDAAVGAGVLLAVLVAGWFWLIR
jgi:hypothetical protein